MKKIPSYPKISTKTNITVTQTQNININSPKGFGAAGFGSTKKLIKVQKISMQKGEDSELKKQQPASSKSKLKTHYKPKPQIGTRRQSSGNLNKPSQLNESKQEGKVEDPQPANKQQIKKIEEKLKELQKKIDILKSKKKKKELSSQRNHSKIKQTHITTIIENKSTLSTYGKKKQGSIAKILKKTQSDKYLLRPPIPREKKEESVLNVTNKKQGEQLIHRFVTQVTRSETTGDRQSRIEKIEKIERSQKLLCYYIENALQSMTKNYLQPFKQHLAQSIQTMKYLQNNRRPTLKELQKNSITLPNSKFKYSLILDLDETLIHCNQNLSIPHDVTLKIKFPTGQKIDAGVNIRPYARQLLKELSNICEIIVFTASHQCYANVVLDHLDPKRQWISHRLFRPHCWQTEEGVYIKDLRVIRNRSIQNMLLVDNAAYSYFYQLQNGIPIIPYYDDKQDEELLHLIHYIKDIITIKQSGKEKSLQDVNHRYFQLSAYSHYQDLQIMTTKLYKEVIIKHKQMIK